MLHSACPVHSLAFSTEVRNDSSTRTAPMTGLAKKFIGSKTWNLSFYHSSTDMFWVLHTFLPICQLWIDCRHNKLQGWTRFGKRSSRTRMNWMKIWIPGCTNDKDSHMINNTLQNHFDGIQSFVNYFCNIEDTSYLFIFRTRSDLQVQSIESMILCLSSILDFI